MSFGTKLKMIRIEHKLDQNAMCKQLLVSQTVYSRYENDEKEVDENHPFVIAVAEAFNKSAKWLVAPDHKNNAVFESGSIVNGNGIGQVENYYSFPKNVMDTMLHTIDTQQSMMKEILQMLSKNK